MKKILIWDMGLRLRDAGGPTGYIWNLKTYMSSNHGEYSDQIFFYSDIFKNANIKISLFDRIVNAVLRHLGLGTLAVLYTTYYAHSKINRNVLDQLRQFDYVHIHNMHFILRYASQLRLNGLKIIYTTHTPEFLFDEIISSNKLKAIEKALIIRNHYIKRELYAYKAADYILFPVPGVEECYTCSSLKAKKFFEKANNIFYTPTAILDDNIVSTHNEALINNVPKGAITIGYIGRHTVVKGYEYLKKIAAEILSVRDDVYFIIGGNQGGSCPLNHPHWIELGWVNTREVLKDLNLFILANQQTYFDLIALEVMRSSTPIVTTLTGGNKYLSTINNGSLTFIPTDDYKESAKIILQLLDKNLCDLGIKSRELFEGNFTFDTYLKKYTANINDLK